MPRKTSKIRSDEAVDNKRSKKASEKRREKTKDFSRTTKASGATFNKVTITPKTDNQRKLVDTLDEKVLTIVVGPAGTGKTYLTAYAAAKALANKDVLNILITRSMITVGKEIGHLPGSEVDKMLPYVAPMLEYFSEFFGKEEVSKMIKADVIRVVPIALLRGYTFHDTFVILDESQNTTPHEFKTILTRIGDNSKMAVLGDIEQSDLGKGIRISGPEDFVRRMHEPNEYIGVVELDENDILRSPIVKDIVKIYKQEYYNG